MPDVDTMSLFARLADTMNLPMALVSVVSIAIGLCSLLWGYRLFRLFVFLTGFIVGTIIINTFQELPIALLGGLLVGAICCVLWYLGVFLLGAAFGAVVAWALGIHEQMFVLVMAVIFGCLAIAIRKFMIIVSTSWQGATLIVGSTLQLLNSNGVNVDNQKIVELAVSVLLAVVGIVCQYTVTSGKKPAVASPDNGSSEG